MALKKGKETLKKDAKVKKRASKKGRFLPFIKAPLAVRILIFLAALIFLLVGLYQLLTYCVASYFASKIQYQTTPETNANYQQVPLTDAWQPATENWTGEDVHGILNNQNLPAISDTRDVTNVLLLATDSRGQDIGRSDTMILATINRKTGTIVLTSFLRDILAKYPEFPKNPISGGTGYDKLTHAHAYGGPELTMAVFKETFNIQVDYYARVNFDSFVHIIDSVGGVDLYLTEAEVRFINEGVNDADVFAMLGSNEPAALLEVREGMHHLTGLHALRHARNRYTNGDDRARTDRQRIIIDALIKKAQGLSISALTQSLNTILPMITTNMPKSMVTEVIQDAPTYIFYDLESLRLPLEGSYTVDSYNFILDLEKNCKYLYEKIYGESVSSS